MVPQPDDEGMNSKSWKLTDDYKYPVPNPPGNPWDIILGRFLAKDKFQCDAWKDEVQNLLLFAGLFSAVVTAFAVESYKTLQPDPNDVMTALLAHIAVGVDTLANLSTSDRSVSAGNIQFPTSFSPTTTAIHINIFWFSSLILSLATVIVGIVSLQWLREHQRYTEPLNSKQALAVFHLRSAALKKWAIPHIFTTLPVILQVAVILFFVGLVEFLFTLSPTVAIPALVLISLPVLFLIITTVLPTLQLLFTSFRLSSDFVIPTQCAFKSPQSWAFLHLALLGLRISGTLYHFVDSIPWFDRLSSGLQTIGHDFSKVWSKIFKKSDFRIIALPLNVQAAFNRPNWVYFDVSWLTLRDAHYLSQKGSGELTRMDGYSIHLTYDLMQALVTSAKEHAVHEECVLSAYHGMKELCDTIVSNEIMFDLDLSNPQSETVVTVLQSGFPPFRSEAFSGKAFGFPDHIMRDEIMLAFLRLPGINNYSSNIEHPIGLHRLELFTRMLVYNRFREVGYEQEQMDPAHPFFIQISEVESAWEVSYPEDIVQQHYLILEHIFVHAFNQSPSEITTSARYTMLIKYFDYISRIRIPESMESDFLSVLSTISKCLTFSLEGRTYDGTDFLFFCVRLYLENLARRHWFSDLMKSGSYGIRRNFIKILETMLRYEQQLDKLASFRMARSWAAGLPSGLVLINHPDFPATNPIRFIYEPIPETLLRFIPYDQRNLPPQPPSKFLDHGQFAAITVPFTDKIDLDGERISFSEPLDDTW